jgi:hypothetical protein
MVRPYLLAACSAFALLLAGCGGGGQDSASSTGAGAPKRVYLAAVARAADVTGQAPGYRFGISLTSKLGGKSTTIDGTGSISDRGAHGSFEMSLGGTTITEVIDKPYIYVKIPNGERQAATHGKPWARADLNFGQSFGLSSLGGGATDPAQTLGFLKAAGTVTRVGGDTVRGAPTVRYHAVIDLDRYAAASAVEQRAAARRRASMLKRITGASSLPIDVWIDARSHVARMALTLSLCGPGGGRLQESLNYELFGYGPQPVPTPPPASQVTDVSSRLSSQLAHGLQQLSCE